MKKLEIIIRPEKMAQMRLLLNECNAKGAMFTRISGYGNQRSKEFVYHGVSYFEDIFQKTKVETVMEDDAAEQLIKRVLEEFSTGEVGDGKIFVSDIQEVIRVRTGERGLQAL